MDIAYFIYVYTEGVVTSNTNRSMDTQWRL